MAQPVKDKKLDDVTLTENTPTEGKRKSPQQVDILVAYYSYKDKVVSAVGIQSNTTVISHVVRKKDIPYDGWFKILQAIVANPDFIDGHKRDLEKVILDESKEIVAFPPQMARIIKTLGDLVHKIETVKVEF